MNNFVNRILFQLPSLGGIFVGFFMREVFSVGSLDASE